MNLELEDEAPWQVVGVPFVTYWTSLPAATNGQTRILLVRHGESTTNFTSKLSGGECDAGLTEKGIAQGHNVADCLHASGVNVGMVASSTLLRAKHTADLTWQRFPHVPRLIMPGIVEMRYGTLASSDIADPSVAKEMRFTSEQWRSGNTNCKVGGNTGESPEDVLERTLHALKELKQHIHHASLTHEHVIVVVTHAHLIKTLISWATPTLGLSKIHSVPQQNCAVNVLELSHADAMNDELDYGKANVGTHIISNQLQATTITMPSSSEPDNVVQPSSRQRLYYGLNVTVLAVNLDPQIDNNNTFSTKL